MKKNLFLMLLLAVQSAFGQIISKDPSFASNGIHPILNNNAWSKMIQNLDGSLYFTYGKYNTISGNSESFLSKLTPNGTVDLSFGVNGEIQLPYSAIDSQIKKQNDGKLVVIGFDDQKATVTRLLPNGQLDTTFGINGTSKIDHIGPDMNNSGFGLLLQNNKIILYAEAMDPNSLFYLHYKVIYRLNENGSIDNSFGNNGFITTQGKYVFLDNQLNITVVGTTIEKYNNTGQPLISYGNNGIANHQIPNDYIGCIYMDSNNRFVLSDIDDNIFRINADGTLDNTFNYNLSAYSGINGGAWILSICEKDGYYYIGGNGDGDFASHYFISKLNQNGSIDSNFSYYSESDSNLILINDMIINNNNIIVNGSQHIVKYLLGTPPTLSSNKTIKFNTDIIFENPVQQNLVYQSKEKINKIEIYSADGKIVKTLKDNNTNVSELLKGVYIAKITFENKTTITKKLLKN